MRTVKPCGPGIPMLMPSLRCDELADDGGKNAGPRGEHGVRRKAIAQGGPDVRLRTCGSAACFLLHADHGCDQHPALPAPSVFEEGFDGTARARMLGEDE